MIECKEKIIIEKAMVFVLFELSLEFTSRICSDRSGAGQDLAVEAKKG
jgi:hypothetical protein